MLEVKDFVQRKSIDFEEEFLLVVKMTSTRMVLGMAASMNLGVEQLDVKIVFLQSELEKKI